MAAAVRFKSIHLESGTMETKKQEKKNDHRKTEEEQKKKTCGDSCTFVEETLHANNTSLRGVILYALRLNSDSDSVRPCFDVEAV